MTQQTLETPENWDAASRGYAEQVAPRMMETFADAILDRLRPDADMAALEVASGSGALTQAFHKRVRSLLAVDFSPAMIELLRLRMAADGAKNVTFEVMDGQALDLADNSFDCAASSFGVMLFPDRAKGFSELNRVVRPGGRVTISAWSSPDKFQAFGILMAAVQKAFPDMPPPPAPPAVLSLADPDVFRAEMEQANFKDVEVERVDRDLELPDAETAWGMMTVGAPPARALLDRVGPEGASRIRDKLYEIAGERFGSGPIRFTNQATIGTGIAG